ncbi:hypothetical protein [Abyssogena phaseoliformis symbiont]|uniref:hypothetical protein n=1 Tax=Abyssogena phaseoliformis symbiont TaxID=596095 RepID=UPI001916774F|nr:hypothetical protein [Abyssogena phaseoliformis symbiont]MBW5289363.1 hypothetical protein [Candidatus Ruthia sp. Apha_13_S6]
MRNFLKWFFGIVAGIVLIFLGFYTFNQTFEEISKILYMNAKIVTQFEVRGEEVYMDGPNQYANL